MCELLAFGLVLGPGQGVTYLQSKTHAMNTQNVPHTVPTQAYYYFVRRLAYAQLYIIIRIIITIILLIIIYIYI